MRKKNPYTLHHNNMDEHQTIQRLRREMIQLVMDKPHPVSVQEIQELVRNEMTIFKDCLSEELVRFLIALDETRRSLNS